MSAQPTQILLTPKTKDKFMSKTNAAIIFTLVLLTSGCAWTSPAMRQANLEKEKEFQRTIPTCSTDKECSAKWEVAQLWVLKNAQYGIRIATPVLIETYFSANLPPYGQDPSLIAAQVTKQPQGNGKYQFNAKVWRYTLLNGDQNQWDAMLDFNKQINSFTP
jgi:hypothetical protein